MGVGLKKPELPAWVVNGWELTRWVFWLFLVILACTAAAFPLHYAMATLTLVEASTTCVEGGYWSFHDCYSEAPFPLALGQFLALPSYIFFVHWATNRAQLPMGKVFALGRPDYQSIALWTGAAVLWALMELLYYHLTNAYRIGWEAFPVTEFLLATSMFLASPVYEELIFRGFLLSLLMRRCSSTWVPVIIISVLFTVAHGFDRSVFFMLSTFLFSILLCFARLRSGTLWVPIAMHVAMNSVLLAFLVE